MKKRSSLYCVLGMLILAVSGISAPVPDSGQTQCYDTLGYEIPCPTPGQPLYGQDANYTIKPMSFSKLDSSGNALDDSSSTWAMVKDNVTGLIWEGKRNYDGETNYNDPHDADNHYSWYNPTDPYPGKPGDGTDTQDLIDTLNTERFGGYSDWRIPTFQELVNIVDCSKVAGPIIDTTYFPNTVTSYYWSSTNYAYNINSAWLLSFLDSHEAYANKSYDNKYVRAVRGEKSHSEYVDNANGTVTDIVTGLTWQQASVIPMTWESSLSYCENLNLGGYSDWRLPNIKELHSLVDYTAFSPAINTTYFPQTAQSWYWSSTPTENYLSSVLVLDFSFGQQGSANGYYENYYVRAVRGGQESQCPAEKVVIDTAMADGEAVLAALRTFRDGFLPKSKFDKSLIRLYYRHSAEGIRLLMEHPEWITRSAALLEKIQPDLVKTTDSGVLRLDASIILEIKSLMDEVRPYASPEMSRFFDTVRNRLKNG